MISKKVISEIDRTIKNIWLNDIKSDYKNHFLENEDCLKNSLYYYIRKRLGKTLKENNLVIFTEWTFTELHYRADMVIAEIDKNIEGYIKDKVANYVAIIELKFGCSASISLAEWIKEDVRKIKNYYQSGYDCQFYFAVIYEVDCDEMYLKWMDKRSTNNWAKGHVTELNSGFVNGKMRFEVNSYNEMNKDLNAIQ